MTEREELDRLIEELEQQQANGDETRLTALRLNSLRVRRKFQEMT